MHNSRHGLAPSCFIAYIGCAHEYVETEQMRKNIKTLFFMERWTAAWKKDFENLSNCRCCFDYTKKIFLQCKSLFTPPLALGYCICVLLCRIHSLDNKVALRIRINMKGGSHLRLHPSSPPLPYAFSLDLARIYQTFHSKSI